MYFLYSLLLSIGFVLMLPLFLLRREKYASGFSQRLGNYPEFIHDDRKVIWLHCVSVGETNAARPLVDRLLTEFPNHRLVISTTTKTGQDLARRLFADKAAAIVYFPFDWKFSVRRALANYKPSLILLMETEIWPRFIRESKQRGAKIAIINGRLSEKSFARYARIRAFLRHVLIDLDLLSMQSEADAQRIIGLGADEKKVAIVGNLKFDLIESEPDRRIASGLRDRFGFGEPGTTVIIAGSTHEGEEELILNAIEHLPQARLIIAPRHPERFDAVAKLVQRDHEMVRRSDIPSEQDKKAPILLLDSVGELRAAYDVADIAVVCGSFVPHGGQNVLEPAAVGKPVITGPHTHNFSSVINDLCRDDAIIQIPECGSPEETSSALGQAILELCSDLAARDRLGLAARSVIEKNRGATARTIEKIRALSGISDN
jgi:3-deoxy-D-manno-octulosonic-acid transferase